MAFWRWPSENEPLKPEVVAALKRAAEARRSILTELTHDDRVRLLEGLFVDFFLDQWQTLVKWGALTGQSAQVDTGYIAQHTASIVLGEPGQGFRGKGKDLMDGTEVKSAASVSGVDRPRWNHNLGTVTSDAKRRKKGLSTVWQEYLNAPSIFYLLFDRMTDGVPAKEKILRVRAWCIDAQADEAWRSLILKWTDAREGGTYNLQLHPPVGYNDSIVVNSLGNLDMAAVQVLEARIHGLAVTDDEFSVEWIQKPTNPVRPVKGRCVSLPWGGPRARPSRLNSAADMLPDPAILQELLPGVDLGPAIDALIIELAVPDEELEDGGQT